ncbi:hypothetical protein [Hamadaea tsunoensis]|uniref:hypothetical protein n=1 Tax=Hamadaea tsunoensis TaxID=53368 RepID=UPI00040A06AE|nr:hypothetical protein [Hamadaea tsunoensis]
MSTFLRTAAAVVAAAASLTTIALARDPHHDVSRPAVVFVPAADPIIFPQPTVTYVHYRQWTFDPLHPIAGVVSSDVRVWWNIDGAALIQRCNVTETKSMQPIVDLAGPKLCPDMQHLPAGRFSIPAAQPLPTDEPAMRRVLSVYAAATSGHSLITATAALYRQHILNPQQRAAVLLVLADIPQLMLRGNITDRAGRPGEAYTLDRTEPDGATIEELLAIDPHNGDILGYDKVLIKPGVGSEMRPNTVVESVTYLDTATAYAIPSTPAMWCSGDDCTSIDPAAPPPSATARPRPSRSTAASGAHPDGSLDGVGQTGRRWPGALTATTGAMMAARAGRQADAR